MILFLLLILILPSLSSCFVLLKTSSPRETVDNKRGKVFDENDLNGTNSFCGGGI